MLCVTNGQKIEIREYSGGNIPIKNGTDCLQAGPLLVKEQKIVFGIENVSDEARKLLDSVQNQSFVCVDRKGDVIVGVSERMTLLALLPSLVNDLGNGGLGCETGMRLTGSITAGLLVDRELIIGSNDVLLPNVLTLSR
jgi:hypothetical protein